LAADCPRGSSQQFDRFFDQYYYWKVLRSRREVKSQERVSWSSYVQVSYTVAVVLEFTRLVKHIQICSGRVVNPAPQLYLQLYVTIEVQTIS